MPEVTQNKAIQRPLETIEVNGMKIEVGEPPWDQEMDFDLLLGDNASNRAFARSHFVYLWVRRIDGEDVWPLQHYSELRALRNRVGRDGYTAVIEAIAKITNAEEQRLKNLPSTPPSDQGSA